MFVRSSPLIHLLNQFRVAWLQGGYGSGKTLMSYALAYDLYQTGRYRYILGNSHSVWTDSPADVKLRDGAFVDAIVILDEGGLFMKLSRDADKFLLGLRKLNITILVPSVLPPSSRIKFLQIQRTFNAEIFGFPFWLYQYRLNIGSEHEKDWFGLYKPSTLYGIYDTLDYPVDDLYLSAWFEYWMETARESRPEWANWGAPPNYNPKRGTRSEGSNSGLDEITAQLDELTEAQDAISNGISFYADEGTKKRRFFRS